MNIVIIEDEELDGADVRLMDSRSTHIQRVLQAEIGDRIRVGRLNGPLGQATIMDSGLGFVQLRCEWNGEHAPAQAHPDVDLLLAMPRPKVMRRLWAHLTALGVRTIHITNAEKVERGYFDSKALDPVAVRSQLVEGLQQCGTTQLPRVEVHRRLKPFVEDQLGAYDDKRVCVVGTQGGLHAGTASSRVLLAIGPEGGWTPYERALFIDNGFHEVGMGERILRSDTACIAAVALLRDALLSS